MARNFFVLLPPDDPNEEILFENFDRPGNSASVLRDDLLKLLSPLMKEDHAWDADWSGRHPVFGIPPGTRRKIYLSPDAADVYNQWRISTKNRLLKEYSSRIYDFCGKATGEYSLKFAMSLAFGRQIVRAESVFPGIDSDTMRAAISICDYLIQFLIFIYEESSCLKWDERLVLGILERSKDELTLRDMKSTSRRMREVSPERFSEIIRKYRDTFIVEIKTPKTVKYAYCQ